MAHTVTWRRGDGKYRYQPAVGAERMWLAELQGFAFEAHTWSSDAHTRPLLAATAGDGYEVPLIERTPILYRSKWWAQRIARREERRRAKEVFTEVDAEAATQEAESEIGRIFARPANPAPPPGWT